MNDNDSSPSASRDKKNDERSTNAPSSTVTNRSTSRPTNEPTKIPLTATVVSQPLEILGINSKDAGIGDGSAYVYADIVNHSDELYSYVGLEATCRDVSGQAVATGIGNTMNLAPGETTKITIVIMSAQGCERVHVEFDDLTGLIN